MAPPTIAAPTPAPMPSLSPVPRIQENLADALTRAKTAETYRVELSVSGKGNFAAAGGPTPTPDRKDEPLTLMAMEGEVRGEDLHFRVQGLFTSFLGLAPQMPFEVIRVNDTAYLKGPVPLLGAREERWYEVPPQAAQVAQPPLTPAMFLDSFGRAGIDPADFVAQGTEMLDGQTCSVYAGDKDAVFSAFQRIGGSTGATTQDLESIDTAEFKFWVCADGYLHQARMLIEGHDSLRPDQSGSFEILMRITDFGGEVAISPPADAVPLRIPQPSEPTATP
jgi:hypothetical protein